MTGGRQSPRRAIPARAAALTVAVALGLAVAGCGIGANGVPASFPVTSVGPSARVTGATGQTHDAIVRALGTTAVQLGEASRPYRPAESARLRDAARMVYQVVLPDQPDSGFIVVYEFADSAAAVDAGNEEAGYLGSGPARVQFPFGTQHVLREVGPTLVLYSWLPAASSDPTAADVARALSSLGVGFTVPN